MAKLLAMREYHKPVKFELSKFNNIIGGSDPADVSMVAHESAELLLSKARSTVDQQLVERLISFTDVNGIDPLTQLWAHEEPDTLPGVLWRLYLLRLFIRQRQVEVSLMFQHALYTDATIHPVVAGVEDPWGPDEVVHVADEILRGAFQDDFAVALERAAAFCNLTAKGATEAADDADGIAESRALNLTKLALRLSVFAESFITGAALWRRNALH